MRILTRRDTGLLTQLTFGTSPLDPDAVAFINAAAITDVTQQSAIVNIVQDLKTNNLWTKLNAVYPFVGGSAISHSLNLVNVSQFQITWGGGVTHNSNGITGNGVNSFGNTNFQISNFAQNNLSFGVYSRTNSITTGSLGADAASFNGCAMFIKFTDNNTYFSASNYILDGTGNYVTDTRGLFVSNRLTSTNSQFFRNGVSLSNPASTSTTLPTFTFHFLARNQANNLQQFDSRNFAFGFLGQGFTPSQQSSLYTIIQNFQTTLGRQV